MATVSEILDNVINLSVGINDVDTEEKGKFLKYLNMACRELYRLTAPLDDNLSVTHLANGFDETAGIELYDADAGKIGILTVRNVRTNRIIFERVPYLFLQEKKFLNESYRPIYCVQNNVITIYSNLAKPYDVFIGYVPDFIDLQEESIGSFPHTTIPFRPSFQNLLVYGTLYYVYQDMDGFKSSIKESIAVDEWTKGKMRYSNYLLNTSPLAHPLTGDRV